MRAWTRNRLRHNMGLPLPDEETLGRGLVAPAGVAILVGPQHEEAIKAALVEGLAEHRAADGSYRVENEYRFLIARA